MVLFSGGSDTLISNASLYLLVILLPLVLYLGSGWLKIMKLMLQMPGPPALPLLGNALLIANTKNLMHLSEICYATYGPVMRVWGTIFPFVVINEPKYVQAVLSSPRNTDKIVFYKLLHNFLGQGLITSSGDRWQKHRKLIQPCFHMKIMETFIPSFAESSNVFLSKLRAVSNPKCVNILKFVNESVLDILNVSILGLKINRDRTKDEGISPFRQGKVVAQDRITRPWLLLNFIYNKTEQAKQEASQKEQLFEFTRNVVRRKMEEKRQSELLETDLTAETSEHKLKSFVDFMIDISEKDEQFSEKDIVDELCTFMLAGQDSVGAAIAFCLHFLSKHQDIQDRVIDELDAIFQDSTRTPTIQDLREMRYLEQCLKETLRIFPSVPLIARTIHENIPVGNYTLPAGMEVLISPFSLHRLPHIYPEPEKFDPDRFLPENVASRHPYAYIPFSAGPRNCIGYKFSLMEMKTVLSTLLRNYRTMPAPGKADFVPSYRITMRAKGGIWLSFSPRPKTLAQG